MSNLNSSLPETHVGILHYSVPPVIGGVEHVIADHTRLFLDAGFRVRVIAGRGGDDPALDGAEVLHIPEIDSEYPANTLVAAALADGILPDEFQILRSKLQELLPPVLNGLDVLIVHNVLNTHFNLPLTAALYHLLGGRALPPLVAWCHDISRFVNPSSGFEQRHGMPWDLMRTFRPDLRYVAVSERRRRMLAETFRMNDAPIRVIPNGISPETLLALSPLARDLISTYDLFAADLILLMPIRVTRAKNIEFALRTTAALLKQGIEARLLVTGPPDPHAADSMAYFQELLDLRRELGIEQHAFFLYEGTCDRPSPLLLPPAAVAECYRLADIVFMPSHREGFGLPVLEAALTGQAVFTTNVPAVDEIGANLVHLIATEETPESVARQMIQWAEDSVEHRLRQRVRQRYTWQAVFDREIKTLLTATTGTREE